MEDEGSAHLTARDGADAGEERTTGLCACQHGGLHEMHMVEAYRAWSELS